MFFYTRLVRRAIEIAALDMPRTPRATLKPPRHLLSRAPIDAASGYGEARENSLRLKRVKFLGWQTIGTQISKGGQLAAFTIALKYCTSLDYVEPAAGVEPATF